MDPIIQFPFEVFIYQLYDYSPPSIVWHYAFFLYLSEKIMVLIMKQQVVEVSFAKGHTQ